MKTRKEQTSRGYLERSTKAVYKQLRHSENMTKKKELAFFINAIIPTRPKCYLWENFPGIEFFGAKLKFKRKERNSSSCVYVLHKTWPKEISRRGRAVSATKRTKKTRIMHVCLLDRLLF